MRYLTVKQITEFIDGEFVGDSEILSSEVLAIRDGLSALSSGSLYFPNTRTHNTVLKREESIEKYKIAQDSKCLCSVIEKSVESELEPPYILVEKLSNATLDFLSSVRPYIKEPLISIGGSAGKTSTKDMIVAVLSQRFKVLKTAFYQNIPGYYCVPIYEMYKGGYDICILETAAQTSVAATHKRHRIIDPDIVVITNIGESHLEVFKTREDLFKAKSKILDYMRPTGIAFLWAPDDMLQRITVKKPRTINWLGLHSAVQNYANNIRSLGLEGTRCDLYYKGKEILDVHIPVPGKHFAQTALTAAAIGIEFGLTPEEIKKGVKSFRTSNLRSKVRYSDFLTIFEDCYNSNPLAVKTCLDTLAECEQRKVFIFGDMAELGDKEAQYHEEIGKYIAKKNIDLTIYIGKYVDEVRKGMSLGAAKRDEKHELVGYAADTYEDLTSLHESLPRLIQKNDVILVKASRVAKFERVTSMLLKLYAPPPPSFLMNPMNLLGAYLFYLRYMQKVCTSWIQKQEWDFSERTKVSKKTLQA